jgi:hypothetical protein
MTAATPRTPAMQAFQIRPTQPGAVGTAAGSPVDELMIDWSGLPQGSTAAVYLPAVAADQILALAASMYVTHRFTLVDEHTLACPAGGITYLPIPPGGREDFAGLLTVHLPETAAPGAAYSVTVRQVTSAATVTSPKGNAVDASGGKDPVGRRVLGTFQFSLSVKPAETALVTAGRLYSIFQWIQQAHTPADRWHPVLDRYLIGLAGLITALGADPAQIPATPTGYGSWLPVPIPLAPGPGPGHGEKEVIGKIEGLVFDRFGDFEGFTLQAETGRLHRFHSREPAMYFLARQAWAERTRIAVGYEPRSPHIPRSVVLLAP